MSGNWTSPIPHGNNPGKSQTTKPQGPPYAPTMAIVGGEPSPAVDDPIAAVLLLLFLLSAAAHMIILQRNKQRHLKFIFSGLLFALCLLRGISLVTRMIWASYPKTVNAIIAASVMTQCGSVLIFVINLFFAQRILRAYHPRLGWHRCTSYVVWFLIACVLCCLIMAIVATIHSFFTLDKKAQGADHAVQLFAGFYLAFLAFLPVPVVGIAAAARPRKSHVEKFGAGRWRAKVGLLVFTALVATLGAAFRVGVNFDGRPSTDPRWFHSKACYYGFNFVTDLVVSTAYLLARFDRRFIVPDGARGPGDHSPVLPSTDSNKNLVSQQPLVVTSSPVTIVRQPGTPASTPPPPPSRPQTQAQTQTQTTTSPPTSSSSQQQMTGFSTETTNTAVQNTPNTSSSFNRKGVRPVSTPHPHITNSNSNTHINANNKTSRSFRARSRRSIMMRMRIKSEADAYGLRTMVSTDAAGLTPRLSQDAGGVVRAPDPAYLGPPILPDLDLDVELLSATLLAAWALDSWGFDMRGGSRRASLMSKRSSCKRSSRNSRNSNNNRSSSISGSKIGGISNSSGDGGGEGGGGEGGEEGEGDGGSNERNIGENSYNYTQRRGRSMTI
ncbi:hypothetical protein M434DRAFT_28127 [Hypoxylon sp. CO27-5]|nr:hypothetical protein M434DRAFT_28127 [Hypoxylon sp. CO27-5]